MNIKEELMCNLYIYCKIKDKETKCLREKKCKECLFSAVKIELMNDMNLSEIENYVKSIIKKGKI